MPDHGSGMEQERRALPGVNSGCARSWGTSPGLEMKQAWRWRRTRPRSHSNMQSWAGSKSSWSLHSRSSGLIHLRLDRCGYPACPHQSSTFSLVEAAVPPLATTDRSQARNITSLR